MEELQTFDRVLTIAVPAYNMEKHLPKNLPTYLNEQFKGDLEVIILNNASTDGTQRIAQQFVQKSPEIFNLQNRTSKGYGSSINGAIATARGRYFRIVDADDWIDTSQLSQLLQKLKTCIADIVQTNYNKVEMTTLRKYPFVFEGIEYDHIYNDFKHCLHNMPCIHSTTYRTSLLRINQVTLQDNMFFVDEEFVILPFLYAKNVIFYNLNIYQYLVGNPLQSTSPANRAKYYQHREKILKRLYTVYRNGVRDQNVQDYFFYRLCRATGDHLTTLSMCLPDRALGRRLCREWMIYAKLQLRPVYDAVRPKAFFLYLLNRIHMGMSQYEWLKKRMRWLTRGIVSYGVH